MASRRAELTEPPYIENVLDQYAGIPDLSNLALGSSYWGPPMSALQTVQSEIFARDTHRYGSLFGFDPLREKLKSLLHSRGLDTSDLDIMVTAGANQAIASISMALCDPLDTAMIITPNYFSHLLALQLCQASVVQTPLRSDLTPDWEELSVQIDRHKPKVVVLTTPNNPSGLVWSKDDLQRLVELLRRVDAWLVCDQTYYEFLFDGASHSFPCSKAMGYPKIVHIFSFSKVFGMAGWRLGYALFPKPLTESLRKIQDTIPTHANMLAQKLGLQCILDTYQEPSERMENPWFSSYLQVLSATRAQLWPVLQPLGTVQTQGAFYFLVPVPEHVGEDEAVDILARRFKVLLMHGKPFGAERFLRLSYGSLAPENVPVVVGKLSAGLAFLQTLSAQRADARRTSNQ